MLQIQFRPKSSFLTQVQSDTLFGHFCWYLLYSKGEAELKDFLSFVREGGQFAFSSAFPVNLFPKPILKPLTLEERDQIIDDFFNGSRIKAATKLKKFNKLSFIPAVVLGKNINNLSEKNLLESYLSHADNEHGSDMKSAELIIKNTINRYSNTALEGNLYSQEEVFYDTDLRIIFYSDLYDKECIKDFFEYLEKTGFGKNKSTGKGQLELGAVNEVNLPIADDPNAFMSLSNYVPAVNDPSKGTYEIFTKYPKVGGDLAISDEGCWKKPILMYKPGSVFNIDKPLKNTYGSFVDNIYEPNPEVVQCGCALPFGVRLL